MALALNIGKCSQLGNYRENNEDAIEVKQFPDMTVCLVADGMGGQNAGEVASYVEVQFSAVRDAEREDRPIPPQHLAAPLEARLLPYGLDHQIESSAQLFEDRRQYVKAAANWSSR